MNRSTTSLASSHTHVASSLRPFGDGNESTLDMEKHGQDGPYRPYPMGHPAEDASSSDAAPKKTISQGPPIPEGPGGPAGPGGPEPNSLYKPKTLRFWLTLLANFLAVFLVALDRTIVATAIPQITDEYHSLGDIGWYGSAYMLTTSASQLLFGRLFKFYNTKWYVLVNPRSFSLPAHRPRQDLLDLRSYLRGRFCDMRSCSYIAGLHLRPSRGRLWERRHIFRRHDDHDSYDSLA